MFAPLFTIYAYCSKLGWHGAVLLLAACAILLARSGLMSSMLLGLIAYTGVITLMFDRTIRRDLQDANGLGPAAVLLGAIVAWQAAGVVLRKPFEPQAIFVLGSAFGLAMLLPVFAAAAHHTPDFTRRFLAVLLAAGSLAAVASIALHVGVMGGLKDFSVSRFLSGRLVPVGRAHHPILGAGGLVSALFAGLALWPAAKPRTRYLVGAGVVVILLAVLLTQSRGPIASLGLAVAAAGVTLSVPGRRARLAVAFLLSLLCAVVPAALVLGEPWLQKAFCTTDTGLCRIAARQDVWWTVLGMIPERPWLGIGPAFRFVGEGAVPHAHNGLLGSSFFFGVPIALLFLGLVAVGLARTLRAAFGPGSIYALLGVFFGIAFVATDVSNPFAFINTHFLYLWYPLMLGVVLGSRSALVAAPLASAAKPGGHGMPSLRLEARPE